MYLVEQHIISVNDKRYKDLDRICFLSKNLYNAALYEIKQEFLRTGKWIRSGELFKEWAWTNLLKVVAYPEGLQEEAMVLVDDADMEVVYSLSADPTSLSFPAEGGIQKLTSITSVKQTHVDNVPVGKPTNVPYTTAVNGDGFSKGNSDLEVVVSENPTEAARNGTLVITQSEGNKTVSVTLTQVAPSAV